LAEGASIKEIADHLGNTSLTATQIYAKVDLPSLRKVADFDIRELLDHTENSTWADAT
jgi:site-specific recombinase XerD